MKKIFLIFLFFLLIGVVSANNTTIYKENITALESGDSNISFSDGYKGYCIEWGEKSAEKGDTFYTDDNVDNNIKTFFVYFYPESQKDVIATQHMIWKFTDNKEFSKFNKTLYDQIITKSSTTKIPNEGSIPFGENQKMVFSFKNFISEFEERQNYFGYKIFFTDITCQINNSTVNNITVISPELLNNNSTLTFNELILDEVKNETDTSILDYEKIVIFSHQTGINTNWLIGCLVLLIIICLLFY